MNPSQFTIYINLSFGAVQLSGMGVLHEKNSGISVQLLTKLDSTLFIYIYCNPDKLLTLYPPPLLQRAGI
jgi:hypothetical protein